MNSKKQKAHLSVGRVNVAALVVVRIVIGRFLSSAWTIYKFIF